MKTSSEEKTVRAEHKSCSDTVSISREQAVALRKSGEALIELAEELQKTTEYDQQNKKVNHATEDYLNGQRIIFFQNAERTLNDQINALRRSQRAIRKTIKNMETEQNA